MQANEDYADCSDRELLFVLLTKQDCLENSIDRRISKLEEAFEKIGETPTPRCEDHQDRLTKIETTQRVAVGILGTILAVFVPVIMWLVDKVI